MNSLQHSTHTHAVDGPRINHAGPPKTTRLGQEFKENLVQYCNESKEGKAVQAKYLHNLGLLIYSFFEVLWFVYF